MTPDPTDGVTPEPPSSEPVRQRTLWSRIPRRLFGGRIRTTTAALTVLFFATLMLYSQQSAYYEALDEASHTTAPSVSHTDAPSNDDPVPTPPVTYSVTPTPTSEPTMTTTSSVPPEAPDSEVEPTSPTTSARTADTSETPPTSVVPTTTSVSDR